MGAIVVLVECVAGHSGRCYARELVAVAEEHMIPLTWLLNVASHDPMSTVSLYHNEYLHRIPAWHEIGVRLDLTNGGDVRDVQYRRDVIRLGREMLKQCHVKPVSCRLWGAPLLGSDIAYLEDAGIVVTVAEVPGRSARVVAPYHPAYEDPAAAGDARLIVVSQPGIDLAQDWGDVERQLRAFQSAGGLILLMARDDRDDSSQIHRVLETTGGRPARTLTAAAIG